MTDTRDPGPDVGGTLAGRVALVTGAAQGIGFGIARTFAAAGARVVLADVNDDAGHDATRGITGEGGLARYVHLDVGAEHGWREIVAGVADSEGRLDVLVNCAGVIGGGRIESLELDEHRRVQRVNAEGTLLGLKSCVPLLRRRGDDDGTAAVINISSVGAMRGEPFGLSYSASKAAVLAMTTTAAVEWAALGYRIRVNAIAPSTTDTPMTRTVFDGMANATRRTRALERLIADRRARLPLGRLAEPEDMANAALFLASGASEFITGTCLAVDGGFLAAL